MKNCNKAVWCPFKRLINANREYVKHAKASLEPRK